MPDDMIDGYVWSVIIDSIIEDEMVETNKLLVDRDKEIDTV